MVWRRHGQNLELTLNDEAGQPVARRVFMPVDYLSNVNEKTQGVKAQEEKLVRLVFELDKLSAARISGACFLYLKEADNDLLNLRLHGV